MSFEPNISVTRGLDHLATRLDPIIASRLPVDLGGHPWTVVLSELDEIGGRTPGRYSTTDLYAQLKMLTRRLGALGFPFDDPKQSVSTLGRELLLVRNARAHGVPFTTLDAWRAHDYCVRLLEHFEDDGLKVAQALHREALVAYADEEGVAPLRATENVDVSADDEPSGGDAMDDEEADLVFPGFDALMRDVDQIIEEIGPQRLEFEPWDVVVVGDKSVLDDLPKFAAKEKVRAVAREIVAAEGPIHLDRLRQLVAATFGVRKLHAARARQIGRHVAAAGLFIDGTKFVWSADIDPETWREFRPNSSEIDRLFLHISPREIANAMDHIAARDPHLTVDELRSVALETFGRKRRTKAFLGHLAKAEALRRTDGQALGDGIDG